MFNVFKKRKKRLVKELDKEYFMMSNSLREMLYCAEKILDGDTFYNKKYLRERMLEASREFTSHENLVRSMINNLK